MDISYVVCSVIGGLLSALFIKEIRILNEDAKEQATWLTQSGREFQEQQEFDNFVVSCCLYVLAFAAACISIYSLCLAFTPI